MRALYGIVGGIVAGGGKDNRDYSLRTENDNRTKLQRKGRRRLRLAELRS